MLRLCCPPRPPNQISTSADEEEKKKIEDGERGQAGGDVTKAADWRKKWILCELNSDLTLTWSLSVYHYERMGEPHTPEWMCIVTLPLARGRGLRKVTQYSKLKQFKSCTYTKKVEAKVCSCFIYFYLFGFFCSVCGVCSVIHSSSSDSLSPQDEAAVRALGSSFWSLAFDACLAEIRQRCAVGYFHPSQSLPEQVEAVKMRNSLLESVRMQAARTVAQQQAEHCFEQPPPTEPAESKEQEEAAPTVSRIDRMSEFRAEAPHFLPRAQRGSPTQVADPSGALSPLNQYISARVMTADHSRGSGLLQQAVWLLQQPNADAVTILDRLLLALHQQPLTYHIKSALVSAGAKTKWTCTAELELRAGELTEDDENGGVGAHKYPPFAYTCAFARKQDAKACVAHHIIQTLFETQDRYPLLFPASAQQGSGADEENNGGQWPALPSPSRAAPGGGKVRPSMTYSRAAAEPVT